MHSVAAASGWYSDSGHGKHAALELLAANVPGLHAVGFVVPTPHEVPAGHARHWSAELRPVALLCRCSLIRGLVRGRPQWREIATMDKGLRARCVARNLAKEIVMRMQHAAGCLLRAESAARPPA